MTTLVYTAGMDGISSTQIDFVDDAIIAEVCTIHSLPVCDHLLLEDNTMQLCRLSGSPLKHEARNSGIL